MAFFGSLWIYSSRVKFPYLYCLKQARDWEEKHPQHLWISQVHVMAKFQLWVQLSMWNEQLQLPWHLHSWLQLCCWCWFNFTSGLQATWEPCRKPARCSCACRCPLARVCVSSPSGPSGLGIREPQGLLCSLPCPAGRGYSISQPGKRKLMSAGSSSTSNQRAVSQSKMFWWQLMPGFALNCPWGNTGFLQLPILRVEVPCTGKKDTINKNYQKLYKINKISCTWPQWAMPDFASQGCWPSVGLYRR